jgi:phosphate starvation-inducible PhoH-like protein
MAERTLSVDDVREQRLLFGSLDRNLRAIRERWGVSVSARRGNLRIAGDDEDDVREVATRLGAALQRMRKKGEAPTDGEVFSILLDEEPAALATGFDGRGVPGRGVNGHGGLGTQGGAGGRKPSLPPAPLAEIRPLTENQRAYVEAIRANDVVFAIGPAGTGKTYLAVAEAVAALRSGEVRKLMLTRPAVEAGEKLGFLPGDFQAKINPYLRPLYDALEEMLRYGEVQRSIENGLVEIVPLAYMRGRTLKNAFIILDEAQNTTHAQMKMFLTRMGSGSKIVVTGDVTQMDLPEGATSGLVEAARVLRGVKGLTFVEFQGTDIIRHPMVQRIVEAYERADAVKSKAAVPGTGGPVGP